MADLIQPRELASFLHLPSIPADQEKLAIRNAQGWLRSVTRLAEWPDPVPDALWSWAIELAALAYSNPGGLDTDTTGEDTAIYAKARRAEILTAAAAAYPSTTAGPQGCFPPPEAWPA